MNIWGLRHLVERFAKSFYFGLLIFRKGWGIILFGLALLIIVGCQTNQEEPEITQTREDISVLLEPTVEIPVEGEEMRVRSPGKSYERMVLIDETVIEYALVLPDNFVAGQTYPILLALPPGDQSEAMVEAGLGGYWEAEAAERGWIVISPIAPNGVLFFRGAEGYLPEMLARISAEFPPEGGKYHVVGISNGGISAFRFAIANPDLTHSIVVLPGYPLGDFDQANLANLVDIPVAMYVGENDGAWVSRMETAEQALTEFGATVALEVVPGEGHVIRSIGGDAFFDLLDGFREG